MQLFKKEKQEIKEAYEKEKNEIQSVLHDGKILVISLIGLTTLSIGFLAGSISTAIVLGGKK